MPPSRDWNLGSPRYEGVLLTQLATLSSTLSIWVAELMYNEGVIVFSYGCSVENKLAVLDSQYLLFPQVDVSRNQHWNSIRTVCKNEGVLRTGSHLILSLCCMSNADKFSLNQKV
jgi:hypothetical protein